MNSSLLWLLVVIAAHSVLSLTDDEIKEECNKKSGFDGDIEKLNFNDPAISKEAKCAVACTLEKKNMFKSDGSIDKEKQKPVVVEMVKDDEMKERYLNGIDECDASAKANKCETAYEFYKCVDMKAGII